MTIRVALHHRSHYRFDRAVAVFPHEIRLKPAAHSRTPISAYSLKIQPAKHFVHWQQDAYGNFVARLTFPEPAHELTVTVDLIADMTIINPFDFFVEPWAEHYPFQYPAGLQDELTPFLRIDDAGPALRKWLSDFRRGLPANIGITNFLVYTNQCIQRSVSYLIRLEPGVQSCE